MKEMIEKPGFLSPYGTLGADLSYLLAILFTLLFMYGWYQAKKSRGKSHHTLTLAGMIAMLAYFVVYYLARELGSVAAQGKEGFGGGAFLYHWLFSPVLTIHIWIVTVGIVMAVYMILLGFRTSEIRGADRILRPGDPRLSFRQFAAYTLGISILLAFILFGIRSLFRSPSWGLFIAWFLLCAGSGIILIGMDKLGARLFPDGARRHRILGTVTMILYATALATSTATYLMLYVFWPPLH